MDRIFKDLSVITLLALIPAGVSAQFLVADWSFNTASSPSTASVDNVIGGSAGDATGAFFGFAPTVGEQIGSPGDTAPQELVGGSLHNGRAARSGPLADGTEASGTRIFGASASTNGYSGITVSWHAAQGYRASRFYQLSVTTNGVDYFPVSGGTGGSASVLGINGQTSSVASVSDDGLVTFVVDDGVIRSTTDGDAFAYEFSYTFAAGDVDNNPNFGIQLAAIYDPLAGDYVSSFAGTTGSADPVSGYIRSDASGGSSIFYDSVQITAAVPEPGTVALSMGILVLGVVMYRRRRS